MRWFTWLMPVLAVVSLLAGIVIHKKDVFQVSTGWLGFFVFVGAFFVLYGTEKLIQESR